MNEKICSSCREEKSILGFSKSSRSKDGYCPICKACAKLKVSEWVKNNPSKRAKNQKNYYLRHSNKLGMKKKTRLYELSEENYNQFILEQKNSCALCETSFLETKPCVDHNHQTGKVRGLLCNGCNANLERLRSKDKNWLQKAQKYLEL